MSNGATGPLSDPEVIEGVKRIEAKLAEIEAKLKEIEAKLEKINESPATIS